LGIWRLFEAKEFDIDDVEVADERDEGVFIIRLLVCMFLKGDLSWIPFPLLAVEAGLICSIDAKLGLN
jgi:hypothetical protein